MRTLTIWDVLGLVLLGSVFSVIGQHIGAYLNGNTPDIGLSVGLFMGYLLGALTVWSIMK